MAGILAGCETMRVSGDVGGGIVRVRQAQEHPDEREVLHRSREEVMGAKSRAADAEKTRRQVAKGAKVALRHLFRQADLLDEDEIRVRSVSRAERMDREARDRIPREESGDAEYERRRARWDGNTTNLKKVAGGQVGVTESLNFNYQRRIYEGKLDIRPKVDTDSVGVHLSWKRTF